MENENTESKLKNNHGHGHSHSHDHCCDKGLSAQSVQKVQNNLNLSKDELVESLFTVAGMDCADEIAAINNSLKIGEVASVEANLMTSTVKVSHSDKISKDEIKKLINKSGVHVVDDTKKGVPGIPLQRIYLVAVSGAMLAIAFVCQFLNISRPALIALCLASIGLAGILVFPKALRAIKKFHLDMNVLMTVAVAGAVYLGDYTEGATVVFLFALSELLEAFSVVRARKAISEVMKTTPQIALVKGQSGDLIETPVANVKIKDIVVVRAGDAFPIDGIVVSGQSDVNQATLTGESAPIKKKTGDLVYAGTINISAVIEMEVTQVFKDSKVSQIIKLVEEAQKSKAPLQSFVDKFAKIYTPAVFILAILVIIGPPLFLNGIWEEWIYKGLVLLVIACPCALVISTPVSIASALTAMARRGVLVKGGKYLEALGKLKALAVDKTGTITEGIPQIVQVKLWDSSSSNEELIRIAASMEKTSNHPLAQAVTEYAKNVNCSLVEVSSVQTNHGRGIFAKIDEHEYFLGNHRFAHELGVCSAELEQYLGTLEDRSLSVIIVGHKPHDGCEGQVLGVLGVGDKVKGNAATSIQELHNVGCKTIVMLSGDNEKTALSIAKSVGIDQVYGDLLPENKVEKVKELVQKYKFVGMVGDGVNDAPALAQATVGIAMGMVGTDAAIETADVTLIKDDLSQLAVAVNQGQRALGIIRFNIGFALALKAVFLVLALFGYSSMWMAVAADTGATLLVVLNALRLLKH